MNTNLFFGSIKNKYCSIFFLGVGLTYFVFKSSKIQKFMRYVLNKWLPKNNVTHVVSSTIDTNFAINQLKRRLNEKKVLGLDCEWVSTNNSRHPVALLQLATSDGFCSLFRLCLLKGVPTELADLLEDKSILKVGVAVIADARYLLADYGVYCQSCLDLRHLAYEVGVEQRGLASLSKHLFEIELEKDWRVRCSNWESETLSPVQIQYAAQDACIAVDIFNRLNHEKICQQFSIWQRIFWHKTDYWNHSLNLWSMRIGINFREGSRSGGGDQKQSVRKAKPVDTIIKRNYNTLLHKHHYSNIFLLAPDNQVLCTISTSKADWYIDKELVDVISNDPKTLKLRFEPSRRTNEPDGYYTKPKDNRCVVCGCERDLRRKNVVPTEYRRHFEDVLKNHHSHDVLLLCLACHTRSNIRDQELRDRLVIECDAPLADGGNSKLREMPHLRALRSAARALYNSGDVIPQERRVQLETIICDKLGVSSDQLTVAFLGSITNIDCFVESDKYVPHGLKVVQHYMTTEGVEGLERRWRQHFLDTMAPRYLPELWSVNYIRD